MTIPAPFTDVETALTEMRAGRVLVLVDDEDRENEGDLTLAAEKVTAEAINFMATSARSSDPHRWKTNRCNARRLQSRWRRGSPTSIIRVPMA